MMRRSLKFKSFAAMMLFSVLLSETAIIISYEVYSDTIDKHYMTNAMNIAKAAASQMDGNKIRSYIKKLQALDRRAVDYQSQVQLVKDRDYYNMLNILYELKKCHKVMYLYVEKINRHDAMYLLDADSSIAECKLGEIYPVSGDNSKYYNELEDGIPAFISNTKKFGWLCSAGAPIFDSYGSVVAMAFTDISMDEIMEDRHQFLVFICSVLFIAAVAATSVITLLINNYVLTPINALATAAAEFVCDKDRKQTETGSESAISKLDIHTGDEIENLFTSVKTMELDINRYIRNITAITAEKERISTELKIATRIQASMLPRISSPFLERDEFDIFASMQSSKEVCGDFYDFFLIDSNHLAIVIADVSGKGILAALFMLVTKTLIKNQAQAGLSPCEVFTSVNARLCENNEAELYATAWFGVLEISTGNMTYVNAGHNHPLLKRRDGCYLYLKSNTGFVLAGMEEIEYPQNEIELEQGDVLYLYTDGITMAQNQQKERYGEFRLQDVLNRNLEAASSVLLTAVKQDIEAFVKDTPQSDDMTMLALIIRG